MSWLTSSAVPVKLPSHIRNMASLSGSTLFQVMAWCRQTTSHHQIQWWSSCKTLYGDISGHSINHLLPNCTLTHRTSSNVFQLSQYWMLHSRASVYVMSQYVMIYKEHGRLVLTKHWIINRSLTRARFSIKIMQYKISHYKDKTISLRKIFIVKTLSWWRHQNGNIFRVTGPLCGEFTDHRRTPLTKASGVELRCFLLSAPE